MRQNNIWIKTGNFLFRYRGQIPMFFYLFALIYVIIFPVAIHSGYALRIFIYTLISFTGLILRIDIVGHVPAGTSGRNRVRQVAEQLNTTGWYSILRHPLYVSNFFLYLGPLMITESLGFIMVCLLLIGIYFKLISMAEDDFLFRKFGDEFQDWAITTPAFVPVLEHFKPPVYAFSAKKVLINEYHMILEVPFAFVVLIVARYSGLIHTFCFPLWGIILLGSSFVIWIFFHVYHIRKKT